MAITVDVSDTTNKHDTKRSTFTPLTSLILKMIKSCETCLSDNSLLLTRDTRRT